MRLALRAVLALALLAGAPARAQPAAEPGAPPSSGKLLSPLMDSLALIERMELAGLFAYIPPDSAAMALAGYLYADPKGLKLFLNKAERDSSRLGGITVWDKMILLYLVGMDASGVPPPPPGTRPLKRKVIDRISRLSLEPSLSLSAPPSQEGR